MSDVSRTNLEVPVSTKERVDREAHADRRSYKAELIVLVEEALVARERKAAKV